VEGVSDAPSPTDPALLPQGAVAVVTGGAGGIGRAIAVALLGRGASVVIGDIEEPVLADAVAELSGLGDVSGVRCDVSDEASVAALADHVWDRHGRCDLLFLNAGVTSGGGGLPWQMPLLVVVFSDRVLEEGMGRLYGAYRAVDVVTVLTGPAKHSV
jgi:NAD(P)-dependent dehydrogenase (short-subunit alcohol dehydrogenase family)